MGKEMPISNTGFWVLTQNEFENEHAHDPSLSKALIEICPKTRIYDFGCGPGNYVQDMRKAGIESLGFDGNPVTASFPHCAVADLTDTTFRMEPVEFVMCLEVGEHVPKEYEDKLFATLDHHVLPGGMVVLSWAVPGQGGYGHVNCQTNEYVRDRMSALGYTTLPEIERVLRSRCSLQWFKNTIMAFRKASVLHTDMSGGLGNQLFKVAELCAKGRVYCICTKYCPWKETSPYANTVLRNFSSLCTGAGVGVDTTDQNYSTIAHVLPEVCSKIYVGDETESVDAAFLHIRGGDYVGHGVHHVPLDAYYETAVSRFSSDTLFYVFTNDVKFAKTHTVLRSIRHEFVECDEIEALGWMKRCKRGGICANSSFSWWGAVLDMNRTLVIPSRWTNDLDWNAKSDYRFPGAIIEHVPLDMYCIHLAHRTDRMEHIERLRARYPSVRIHVVDAIRDDDGVRGCILSHKKVVAYAKAHKLPFVVVLEDDCDFLLAETPLVSSFLGAMSYMLKHPNVEVVNGCGNLPTLKASVVDSHFTTRFMHSPDVRTTHCMIYGANAYDKILSLPETIPLDVQMNTLNMMFTYPYLATQLPSYSDIMKEDVEYQNIARSQAFVKEILEGRPPNQVLNKRVNPLSVLRIPIRTNRM
jgi:hypothetical protein